MAEGQIEGKLPIIGTAVTAWGDAFRAVSTMPGLAGIVFAILLVLGGVNLLLMPDPLKLAQTSMPFIQVVTLITTIVTSFLLAPLAIAVHRMVLLGETTDRYALDPPSPRYLRFVGFGILVTVLWSLPNALTSLSKGSETVSTVMGVVSFVLVIVIAIVTLRRLILFPAIAVDAAGATWSNARNDTKGHSWRVLFIFICTLLPMTIVSMPLTFILLVPPRFGEAGKIVFAVLSPAIHIVGLCALAAMASHLYKAYASRLIDPRGGAAAPVTAPAA